MLDFAMSPLPRAVLGLGLASLLSDLSSGMIYPLVPAFVAITLGAGALGLGAMEGAAASLASLSRLGADWLAERWLRRAPSAAFGHTLAGGARTLLAFALTWPAAIALRLIDRAADGIGRASRDALIAERSAPEQRGRAYGAQRALENAGAVLGPAAAAGLLHAGVSERGVFLAAALPAVIAVAALALGVRATRRASPPPAEAIPRPRASHATLAALGPRFRRFVAVLFVFSLAGSSDAFVLLRLSELGSGAVAIALVWTAHAALRGIAVYAGGQLADRFDRRRLLLSGFALYAASYAGFALARSTLVLGALLVVYALHHGAVEAAVRALLADLSPAELRGSAFGWYHAVIGLAALPASLGFAALWSAFGAHFAFAAGALLAGMAALGLWRLVPAEK